MSRKSILKPNNEYMEQISEYGKADAILAFILFGLVMLQTIVIVRIFMSNDLVITETGIFFITGIFSTVLIGIVFLFCKIRKQKIKTIGFNKDNIKKQLTNAFIISSIIIVIRGIMPIISGNPFNPALLNVSFGKMVITLLSRGIYYLVFVAFFEEVIFRGYIGSRLYGYFKNKFFSIIVTGVMFSIIHIPMAMINVGMNLTEYIVNYSFRLVFLVLYHVFFQILYSKYNSLISPVIVHFTIDFLIWFVVK